MFALEAVDDGVDEGVVAASTTIPYGLVANGVCGGQRTTSPKCNRWWRYRMGCRRSKWGWNGWNDGRRIGVIEYTRDTHGIHTGYTRENTIKIASK